MSWQDEADEIEERQRASRELGGKQAVERQHARGRLTVRERIERLVDADSFHEAGETAGEAERDESGRLASFRPTNFVVGAARIGGRACVVAGDDFTRVAARAGLQKWGRSDPMRCRSRIPTLES